LDTRALCRPERPRATRGRPCWGVGGRTGRVVRMAQRPGRQAAVRPGDGDLELVLTALRPASALVLAVTLAATSLTVVPHTVRAFDVPGAVKVDVDHTAKTITFTVRMAFYLRNCPAGASCVLDP